MKGIISCILLFTLVTSYIKVDVAGQYDYDEAYCQAYYNSHLASITSDSDLEGFQELTEVTNRFIGLDKRTGSYQWTDGSTSITEVEENFDRDYGYECVKVNDESMDPAVKFTLFPCYVKNKFVCNGENTATDLGEVNYNYFANKDRLWKRDAAEAYCQVNNAHLAVVENMKQLGTLNKDEPNSDTNTPFHIGLQKIDGSWDGPFFAEWVNLAGRDYYDGAYGYIRDGLMDEGSDGQGYPLCGKKISGEWTDIPTVSHEYSFPVEDDGVTPITKSYYAAKSYCESLLPTDSWALGEFDNIRELGEILSTIGWDHSIWDESYPSVHLGDQEIGRLGAVTTPSSNIWFDAEPFVCSITKCSGDEIRNTNTGICEDPDFDSCLSNPCGVNEECTDSVGSYACECATGYSRDSSTGLCPFVCTGVNEEVQSSGDSCGCISGYIRDSSTGLCQCPTGYAGDACSGCDSSNNYYLASDGSCSNDYFSIQVKVDSTVHTQSVETTALVLSYNNKDHSCSIAPAAQEEYKCFIYNSAQTSSVTSSDTNLNIGPNLKITLNEADAVIISSISISIDGVSSQYNTFCLPDAYREVSTTSLSTTSCSHFNAAGVHSYTKFGVDNDEFLPEVRLVFGESNEARLYGVSMKQFYLYTTSNIYSGLAAGSNMLLRAQWDNIVAECVLQPDASSSFFICDVSASTTCADYVNPEPKFEIWAYTDWYNDLYIDAFGVIDDYNKYYYLTNFCFADNAELYDYTRYTTSSSCPYDSSRPQAAWIGLDWADYEPRYGAEFKNYVLSTNTGDDYFTADYRIPPGTSDACTGNTLLQDSNTMSWSSRLSCSSPQITLAKNNPLNVDNNFGDNTNTIQISSEWLLFIAVVIGMVLLLNIYLFCKLNCCDTTQKYAKVQFEDSEYTTDQQV